jgi:mRNA interferase RelE/StbE
VSRYKVYVTPTAFDEIKDSPGFVRQRVRKSISALADEPRPPNSKQLDIPNFDRELRRLRLDKWRVV